MLKVIQTIKMVRALVAAVIIVSCAGAHALVGGDWVDNGGGLAEKNMMYAYEKLDKYIKICLKSDLCKMTSVQRDLLGRIALALPQEYQARNLFFASEKRSPGFFMIDGLVRVAKTGNFPGSAIYINSDLLYTKTGPGEYDAMTVPEAVAVLIHEMGHHHGNYSHEELDLMGVRVSMMLQQKFYSTPMTSWSSEISANIYMPSGFSDYPEILLSVGDQMIDISKAYADAVMCYRVHIPVPILPLPDLDLVSKKPSGSYLSNVHWDKIDESESRIKVKLIGNVSNNCIYKTNVGVRNNDYRIAISFKANRVSGKWVYDASSLEVDQYRDPWYKIIRLPMDFLLY